MIIDIDEEVVRWSYDGKTWQKADIDVLIRAYDGLCPNCTHKRVCDEGKIVTECREFDGDTYTVGHNENETSCVFDERSEVEE